MRSYFMCLSCGIAGGLTLLSSCAIPHKVQLSDIDNRANANLVPFEIMVSETGVDLGEAARIQRALFKDNNTANDAGNIAAIISLFQMGPSTGFPIYVENYAENIGQAIYQQCPSGHVTGLVSIRETRRYPVISGEIVKIKGYCRNLRTPSSADSVQLQDETENEEL